MRAAIERAWLGRGPLATLLYPLSLLYGLARACAARGGPAPRLSVPIVVVGNVVAGGAGKTPVTIALVEHLRQRGLRVGVVSRGYGRASREPMAVDAASTARDVGDEPLLIARRTGAPTVVAAARRAAVELLMARHPDLQIVVSDDGLQHRALPRDLEICVLDARGVGNGWLLPAGPLREPWPRRADFYLHAGGAAVDALRGLAPAFELRRELAADAIDSAGRRTPLARLAAEHGITIAALAGIAQPRAFFGMLEARGLTPRTCLAMPDHANYDRGLPAEARAADVVLCTEKDAVKLWPSNPGVLAVPLEVSIDAAFWSALDARLAPLLAAPLSSTDGHQTA